MRYETVETFSLNFARKVSTLLNSIDLSVPGCHSENITTQGGISMINEGNFREIVSDITFNPDAYTKEEIHTAFIEMTKRYLNEMINTMNLEKAITKGFDDERAEEILEEIATSSERFRLLSPFRLVWNRKGTLDVYLPRSDVYHKVDLFAFGSSYLFV